MNEFQLTLTNVAAKRGTSVSELARYAGYDPLLFESIVTGKSHQIPVGFFIRITDVLDLNTAEKDALVCSGAFGVERWNWSQRYERRQGSLAKERIG